MLRAVAFYFVFLVSSFSWADSALPHFAGKWTVDQGVMHRQVDLVIQFNTSNSELSLTFIPTAGSKNPSITQKYIVDGSRHDGDGIHTGKFYLASCEGFQIKIEQDLQDGHAPVRMFIGLDIVGLSVWSVSDDVNFSFYQRYTRTDLNY